MIKEFEQFGSKIFMCRQNKNMTQEELSGKLGVTPQALSKWERGQSFPDISMIADICKVLEVSADYLLGTDMKNICKGEQDKRVLSDNILNNLRNSLEPLELIIGIGLVEIFIDNSFSKYIIDMRERFSQQGILMPVLRIKDFENLQANEFMILSYHNILYSETIEKIDESTLQYIMKKLEQTVKNNYFEIINPDMVKNMTDNLQIRFPAAIEGVVPDKISYGLLTEVLKKFMKRGNSAVYLLKIIEYLEIFLRENPQADTEKLTQMLAERLEIKDNFYIFTAKRKEKI